MPRSAFHAATSKRRTPAQRHGANSSVMRHEVEGRRRNRALQLAQHLRRHSRTLHGVPSPDATASPFGARRHVVSVVHLMGRTVSARGLLSHHVARTGRWRKEVGQVRIQLQSLWAVACPERTFFQRTGRQIAPKWDEVLWRHFGSWATMCSFCVHRAINVFCLPCHGTAGSQIIGPRSRASDLCGKTMAPLGSDRVHRASSSRPSPPRARTVGGRFRANQPLHLSTTVSWFVLPLFWPVGHSHSQFSTTNTTNDLIMLLLEHISYFPARSSSCASTQR